MKNPYPAFLLAFLLSLCSVTGRAQTPPWSNVLSTSRAINWSNAGLPATFPDGETTTNPWTPPTRTQCGSTLTPSGGNDITQITSAVAACANGTYVLLGSGTFLIESNFFLGGSYTSGHNYVTVRGSGPMSTKLALSSGVGIYLGAGAGGGTVTLSSSPAQGATSVTLSSSSSAPSVGQVAWLQQCDNGVRGNPCSSGSPTDTGGLYWCAANSVCMTDSPGETYNNSYLEYQAVKVTNVSGATITFTPGLYQPDWSTSRSAVMSWDQSSYMGFGMGLEDFTVQFTSGTNGGVAVGTCYACWAKGLRLTNTSTSNAFILGPNGAHNLIANNYSGDSVLHQQVLVYSYDSDSLVLNNITQTGYWEGGGSSSGEVFAYNYAQDSEFQHQGGSSFNLFEGNQIIRLADDDTWGTHNLNTFFRNYDSCWIEPYNYQPNNNQAMLVDSFARFENVVGNALGSTNAFTSSPECASYGTPGTNTLPQVLSINAANLDSLAASSIMNWGNYAVCSSTYGGGPPCNTLNFLSPGNPTTLTGAAATYNNIASPSTTLPASFFMSGSAAPNWWNVCTAWNTFPTSCSTIQTQPYPLTGPGVSGGLTENPYANTAPAALAFNTLPIDTTYQSSYTVSSSSWSGGVETINISGSFPTIPTHGFQFTGAPGACIPGSGVSYTGRSDGELLMTYPSSTTSFTYALASNPGVSCTGTVLWPDVRKFDERVYGGGQGAPTPPTSLVVSGVN